MRILVAQTDLSEFFTKWNPGANAYQLPGASEMSFEGGVSQSAYNTLASLNLPKPKQGPEKKLIRLPSIRCLLNNPDKAFTPHPHEIRRTGLRSVSGLEESHMAYTCRPASGKLQQTTFNHAF
ncbi:hypothetical protein ACLK1V_16280 [Escherichia coli]